MLYFSWPPAGTVSISGNSTEAKQDSQITLATATNTKLDTLNSTDFATQATLSALNAKVTAVNTGAVVVSSSALPTGAATEVTLAALNTKVTAVDTGAVVVSSSALPTGASTEATLSALNAKVTAVNTGAVVVSSSALPTGAATSALQDTANTSLSSIDGKTPALGQALAAASVPVVLTAAQLTTLTPVSTVTANAGTGTFTTSEEKASTSSVTSVSAATSSTSLLASNTSRKNATFFNDSTAIAYLKLGATASTSSYTAQLAPNGYFELPSGRVYTGAIDCIWSAANGSMRITELS